MIVKREFGRDGTEVLWDSSTHQEIALGCFTGDKGIMRGDPATRSNGLFHDEVRLNLPGTFECDPTLPWIYKCNSQMGKKHQMLPHL